MVDLGNVGLQVFLLGCIHNVMGLSFLVIGGAGRGQGVSLDRADGHRPLADGIAGGLFFLGLAARLALTGRPSD